MKPPAVDEYEQRAMNGTPGLPYCVTQCPHFERDYGITPFCKATEPRTETLWTGKCVCPQERRTR